MKITIVGTGYVGISNAILLAQHNEVMALDIDVNRVNLINQKQSPIIDVEVSDYLENKSLNLTATVDKQAAYEGEIVLDSTKPDGTMRKVLDVSKTRNLGWVASMELREGLILTYEMMRKVCS